ncbi:MAG: NAD-dependent epimerase/dehydratase family protein [Planctomycetota bacterium]|jgi:nucleoside-diphosphate-sugar epimerase
MTEPVLDRTAALADALEGSLALVTGGAGFIGSHLAERLLALGARVRVLDDLSSGHEQNVPSGAELTVGSVLDHDTLHRLVAGCRFVFHEAAMVSVPQSVEEPRRCLEVNVRGTEAVLLAARDAGVERVMFAASAAAYGDEPVLPCREDQPPDCRSPYAASKVAGEHLIRAFATCYGMSAASLRYFNIYGPRQDPRSPYAAVISAFAAALLEGRVPTIFGDGEQTRDFTSVHDVVEANLLAATVQTPPRGDACNVGTGRRHSLLDVLGLMRAHLALDVEPSFGPPRPGDVRHSVADIEEARRLLGYEPRVQLGEGLGELLDWAQVAEA